MFKGYLYVTEWAPNGTNDLIITNESHQIVDAVEEATFGIDVMQFRSPQNDLVADAEQVFSIKRTSDPLPSEFVFVKQIDVETLRRKLCVSPLDPRGESLIRRLSKAGIQLRGEK